MPASKATKIAVSDPNPSVGMDVKGPGKTAPDSTTRPLIMGHKPILGDPMVTPEETVVATAAPEKLTAPRAAKVVSPISEPTVEATDTTVKADTPSESSSVAPQAESDDTAVMEAIAQQAGNNKKAGTESEEDRMRQEAIQKHIADKTYFVPIAQTNQQKKTEATALLGLLLTVIIGAILAIDAGIIDLDIALPFDLIKN